MLNCLVIGFFLEVISMKVISADDWHAVVRFTETIARNAGHQACSFALVFLGAVQREEYKEQEGGFVLNHNVVVERAFEHLHGEHVRVDSVLI
jgi:hypothetical protein